MAVVNATTSSDAHLETIITEVVASLYPNNVTSTDDALLNNSTLNTDVMSPTNLTILHSRNTSIRSDATSLFNLTSSAVNDTQTTVVSPTTFFDFLSLTTARNAYVTLTNTTAVNNESSEIVVLEQRIAAALDFWVPPILFLVGIVANVLVVIVMRSRDFRHMSISFYMSFSSIADTLSLVVLLPAHYLYVNFPEIFDDLRDAHPMCGFFNLYGWLSSDLGVMLTVAMTTERCLAVIFPFKYPTMCTVKRAKIVIFCLVLLVIPKVVHFAIYSRVASKEVTAYLCDVDLESDSNYAIFYTKYWPFLHNIFLLVSFTLIIIGNIFITVHVKRSEESKNIREGSKNARRGRGGGRGKWMTSKGRQLSVMFVIDSATIIICTLPFSIYTVLANAFQLFEDTPQGRGQRSLAFAIVFYLLYANRCANFFLYCVSGERFRRTLKNVLTGKSARTRKRNLYGTGAISSRPGSISSSTSIREGSRISMTSMGPSTISGTTRMNRESSADSTNCNGTSPTTSGTEGIVPSKQERHYGYGKKIM